MKINTNKGVVFYTSGLIAYITISILIYDQVDKHINHLQLFGKNAEFAAGFIKVFLIAAMLTTTIQIGIRLVSKIGDFISAKTNKKSEIEGTQNV
jgi:hypothetical protein